MLRVPALLLGLLALTACGSSAQRAGPTPSATPSAAPSTGAAGGVTRAWVARYGGTAEGHDLGQSVAVGPDGATTFVTGSRGTLAYRTATGDRLWLAASTAFVGSGGSTPPPTLAVSPDGRAVYVAGTSGGRGPSAPQTAMTTAYDARTGTRLWTATYTGPGHADGLRSVAATAGAVLVHGTSAGTGTGTDLVTVAYDPRTGAQKWAARYDGPSHGDEVLYPSGSRALAVTTDGSLAVVTGASPGPSGLDAVTIAYATSDGTRRWVSRYRPSGGGDAATIAVAVGSSAAYVTGTSSRSGGNADVLVLGYDLATGAQRWTSAYDGPAHANEGGQAVAVDPGGTRVVVAGTSEGASPGKEDWVLLGLDAASGARRWAQRYDGPAHGDDNAAALALSPDGRTAYVTGWSAVAAGGSQWTTGAWATADGTRSWVQPWSGTGAGQKSGQAGSGQAQQEPRDLAVSPDGRTVVVTGDSTGYATVAYRV